MKAPEEVSLSVFVFVFILVTVLGIVLINHFSVDSDVICSENGYDGYTKIVLDEDNKNKNNEVCFEVVGWNETQGVYAYRYFPYDCVRNESLCEGFLK